MKLTDYIKLEKKPKKGLLAVEWVVMAYLVATTLLMFFTYVKLHNPESMLMVRMRVVAITVAMWLVYRLVPCRLTHFFRIGVQLLMLSWWYPDTYELNRILPNLDHVVAGWEQQLFGCQPALLFAEKMPWAVVSELMCLGYASYFPLIGLVLTCFFIWRYNDFHRAAFIIIGAFFVYYTFFIFVPVAGPQYYFPAVGTDVIARGEFPQLHDYFATMREALPTPGWTGGIFHQSVVDARAVGERATGAFPSSHVGIATLLLLLAWQTKSRRLFWVIMPLYVLLCLSTVYLYAHYAVDVIGGWVSALLLFPLLHFAYKHFFS
ncbi:MAG: phosphatase PAP2 family protein [Prevotella sp.]|nr:phosphatase PAP2 family protein [Prevotella sp.]